MKKHTKIFMDYWDISIADVTPCFGCDGFKGAIVNDVHHLEKRQGGGDPKGLKDRPDNLIGLCRTCHTKADENNDYNDLMKDKLKERILRKTYG